MGGTLRDIRRGGRMVLRDRGFFALVITTMTVGIASLAAVFSLVYRVLLEPLPYPAAEKLVSIQSVHPQYGGNILSPVATFDAFRKASRTTSDLAAVAVADLQMATEAGPRPLTALLATPSIFDLLGAEASRGRLFQEQEGRLGEGRIAVLSHRFWQGALNADAAVVGRGLRVAGDPVLGSAPGQEGTVTVMGVLPEGVRAPFGNLDPDLWIAESFDGEREFPATHVMAFGRLADGVSVEAAQEELGGVYRRLQEAAGEADSAWRTRLMPLREFLVGPLHHPLRLLFLGGLIVLFVASANTANLLVARAEVRASEAAIRTALGAGRRRLLHQLAAENLIPAMLTGGLGLAGAWGLLQVAKSLGASWLPRRFDVGLAPAVVLVVAGVTLATNLLFALTPAVRFSRNRLTASMKARGAARGGWYGGRFGLVAIQVGLALVLIVTSSLLVQSVRFLGGIDPGFTKAGTLTAWISLPQAYYSDGRDRRDFYQRLLTGTGSLPDVAAVGLINYLPFSGYSAATEIAVEGPVPERAGETVQIQFRAVTHGYLEAMDIPLVAGRRFEAEDLTRAVVVVSAKAARWLWGDRDPLGERVKLGGASSRNPWAEVVGVVGDVQHDSLTQEREPTLYLTFLPPGERMALVVRSAHRRPELLAPSVRKALEEVDPRLPLQDLQPMAARVEAGFRGIRASAWLISLLAGVTLILATIGVYGATYQAVVERRREIGIRYAIGAGPSDILRLVFGRVAPWLAGGLVAGVVGALLLGRWLSSLLFGVGSADPLIFLAASAIIAGVTLLATYVPTRKASKVDPVAVLRA